MRTAPFHCLVVLALASAGCVSTSAEQYWSHPTADKTRFASDSEDCKAKARSDVRVNPRQFRLWEPSERTQIATAYESCMERKGYKALAIQTDTVVRQKGPQDV